VGQPFVGQPFVGQPFVGQHYTPDDNVSIALHSGMGDRLLDFIGFYVLCKLLNYKPNVTFNSNTSHWGDYEQSLFNFDKTIMNGKTAYFHVHTPNPASSLSPYKVYQFVKQFLPDITFEKVSSLYNLHIKDIIKPSERILSKIPKGIENAYGIHLRKSDRISTLYPDHMTSSSEFDIITKKLLDDINTIIMSNNTPTFLIVSEDNSWKNEMKNKIQSVVGRKSIKILEVDYSNPNKYSNYKSILDLWCLSKCKTILQGVKYSSFSILASLLGNGKIINYSKYLQTNHISLIYAWNSVLEINNKKVTDLDFFKNITRNVINLNTNINRKYE
jgi:hypothetical protein